MGEGNTSGEGTPTVAQDDLRTQLHDLLVTQLSDLQTGPLSDTPYVSAVEEPDGMLSLFDGGLPAFPAASVDIPQLVDAILPLFEKDPA